MTPHEIAAEGYRDYLAEIGDPELEEALEELRAAVEEWNALLERKEPRLWDRCRD
jgi:hypothetical protein